MSITLYTSGSTSVPKQIFHKNISANVQHTIQEIKLTSADVVLDIFPANVIAHYTITALPAITVGAHLVSSLFDPYSYIKLFNEFNPTVISLIPRHIEILEKTKGWNELDMSSVRYMVTGSQKVKQPMINSLLNKGVQLVANWYGMTEFPPPVLIGYNSEQFSLPNSLLYSVDFSNDGECIIDGIHTGDIFDLSTLTFKYRRQHYGGTTWKTL